jgi:hypothetical protein
MTLPYEAMVEALVRMNVPREKAEARARAAHGMPAPGAEPDAKDAAVLEKTEQWEIVKRAKAFRFEVWWLSQARAAKQTPGLPDLWLAHRDLPIATWWETKRQQSGRHSAAQLAFAEHCARCGIPHGTGDRFAFEAYLIGLGLVERWGTVLEPTAYLRTHAQEPVSAFTRT